MKRKKLTWLESFTRIFNPPRDPHRICRLCHQRILRTHKWHSVKVGWFAPWYCCEHRDCKNPTMEAPQKPVESLVLNLPFESISTKDFEGDIWPSYEELLREKTQ